MVRPFSSDHYSRHLPLGLESLHHLLAVHAGWEVVAPRAHVSSNRTIGGEKALRAAWRCEPWHAPLADDTRTG